MKCKYCDNELILNSKFCNNCGSPIEQEKIIETIDFSKKIVPFVDDTIEFSAIKPEDIIYSTKTEVDTVCHDEVIESIDIVEQEKSLDSILIWGCTLVMLSLCVLLSIFPIWIRSDNLTLELPEFVGNTYQEQKNNHNDGYVFKYRDTVYMSYGNEIYSYENDFSKRTLIISEYGEYIHVDGEYIYYCDSSNNYNKVSLETKEKEVLIKGAYYVQNLGDTIYFQNDNDDEAIYSYDVKTTEMEKISNEPSYNITVDEDNGLIYYTNSNDALCQIEIDTSIRLLLAQDVRDYYFDGEVIYFVTSDNLQSLDVNTKQSSVMLTKSKMHFVTKIGDTIVCDNISDGPFKIDDQGNVTYFDFGNIMYGQVIDELFIFQESGDFYLYVGDLTGNKLQITKLEKSRRAYK